MWGGGFHLRNFQVFKGKIFFIFEWACFRNVCKFMSAKQCTRRKRISERCPKQSWPINDS